MRARGGADASARRAERCAALAIVTRIEGSAYRRPGARLLIEPEGAMTGGVSGGCLEEDVRRVGLAVVQSGRARLLHYDTGDDESQVWGLGLGCNGAVDLVVQPHRLGGAGAVRASCRRGCAADEPFALSTLVEDGGPAVASCCVGRVGAGALAALDGPVAGGGGRRRLRGAALLARRSVLHAGGGRQVFTEVLVPPPKLLVCGAGDDARPLVGFAAAVGFRVVRRRPPSGAS